MNKSESIKNLAAALSKFQAEIQNPKYTADNPFYHSKYTPLSDVLNVVRPLLTKHGLSLIQSPSGDGQSISIHTILMHESGEWMEFEPLTLKAEKITPQGAGSAITYGRRYALSAVLGIASEDDDDGNSLETKPQQGTSNTKKDKLKNNLADKAKDEPSIEVLKAKWQTLAGDLNGFDDWYNAKIAENWTQNMMDIALTKKLKEKKGA